MEEILYSNGVALVNEYFSRLSSGVYRLFSVSAACLVVSIHLMCAGAQELPPLDESERQALLEIDQGRVTTTISFLASDELEGRGTPSKGFDIASAYVASRFRGAGLQGVGDSGSYFQETTIEVMKIPNEGVRFATVEGQALPHFGLLMPGPEPVEFSGPMQKIDLEEDTDEELDGVVFARVDDSNAPQTMFSIGRTARRLHRRGASVLVIETSKNSALVQFAQRNQTSGIPRGRGESEIPILLVDQLDLESIPEINLQLPAAIKADTPVRNVIGILPGSDDELAEQAIFITAHLDHLGKRETDGEDGIFNGADDNATGVTAVVSLADAFAALPENPKRTMVFVAFWGEERGLLGSRYLVQNPIWPLDRIVANINIEMIGRPEPGAQNKSWMTGWDQSDLGTVMAQGAGRVDIEIFDHPQFGNRLYRASDNWAFVEAGVVAHSFSAGSLHQDYHRPSDEWEKLELEHMTNVIRGYFAGTLPIAQGVLTPEKSESGR